MSAMSPQTEQIIREIQTLSPDEQSRVLHWLESHKTPPPAESRSHDDILEEIWRRQRERGYRPPTRAEVDAYLNQERESWD